MLFQLFRALFCTSLNATEMVYYMRRLIVRITSGFRLREALKGIVFKKRERESMQHINDRVTILAYHFWGEQGYDVAFEKVAFGVRETWKHCGKLKTVLVVNEVGKSVERFAEEGDVEIQIEKGLVPGDIDTMSIDCNGKLYSRFDTENVLIVQNDGYPLRSGLEEFVGEYDFIGAPYVRDIWWKRMVCKALNWWVSNGGFSLRSKEICEKAAFYWRKKYSSYPMRIDFSEDYYYTKWLPIRERDYRRSVKIADNRRALDFSYDAIVPYVRDVLPFGFHGARSLRILKEQFPDQLG